jgi:hypothetical protein
MCHRPDPRDTQPAPRVGDRFNNPDGPIGNRCRDDITKGLAGLSDIPGDRWTEVDSEIAPETDVSSNTKVFVAVYATFTSRILGKCYRKVPRLKFPRYAKWAVGILATGVLLVVGWVGIGLIKYSEGSTSGYAFALHNAVKEEDVLRVRVLLLGGADPNRIDAASGITPLGRAVETGNPRLVRLLLNAGGDPNGGDGIDVQPMTIAIAQDHKELITLLEKYDGETSP